MVFDARLPVLRSAGGGGRMGCRWPFVDVNVMSWALEAVAFTDRGSAYGNSNPTTYTISELAKEFDLTTAPSAFMKRGPAGAHAQRPWRARPHLQRATARGCACCCAPSAWACR